MATNVKINFITGSAAKVNLTSSNVIKATIKDRGPVGATGATGETGASITSAAFSSNDLIFTKDDANTVVLTNAKVDLKGDKGDKGDAGAGITEQTVGFTVTGGTTPKTLTVALDANVSGTNTGDQTLPTKATGAELDNGTDDAKFSTAKALKDSHNVPSVAPGTSGNLLTSNGTDWTSSAPPVSVSVTTKGDLQTFSTVPARLAVGTDGQIPRANSAATNGIEWTPPYNSLSYQALINGGFTVNQRVYVSDATLAAGAYGHDRWKAGAGGGDYTFTQLPQSTQITIKTGKSLIQVVEDKNVIGGTYTLSWEGTAQARFGKDSATPSGSYATSPLTITGQTAGTVMSVEFNEGTLGQVSCANSSVALPFMPKSYEEELRACQRYYIRMGGTLAYNHYGVGVCNSTTSARVLIPFRTKMRTIPTMGTTGAAGDYSVYTTVDVLCNAAPSSAGVNLSSEEVFIVNFPVDSGLTAGQSCLIRNANKASVFLDFSAEL